MGVRQARAFFVRETRFSCDGYYVSKSFMAGFIEHTAQGKCIFKKFHGDLS